MAAFLDCDLPIEFEDLDFLPARRRIVGRLSVCSHEFVSEEPGFDDAEIGTIRVITLVQDLGGSEDGIACL